MVVVNFTVHQQRFLNYAVYSQSGDSHHVLFFFPSRYKAQSRRAMNWYPGIDFCPPNLRASPEVLVLVPRSLAPCVRQSADKTLI
jgi:hypothetical protein